MRTLNTTSCASVMLFPMLESAKVQCAKVRRRWHALVKLDSAVDGVDGLTKRVKTTSVVSVSFSRSDDVASSVTAGCVTRLTNDVKLATVRCSLN